MIVYTVYLSLFLKTWLGMLLETKIYDPMIYNYVPVRILTLVSCSRLNCSPTSMPYMTLLALWLPYLFTNVWLKKNIQIMCPKYLLWFLCLQLLHLWRHLLLSGCLRFQLQAFPPLGHFQHHFLLFLILQVIFLYDI